MSTTFLFNEEQISYLRDLDPEEGPEIVSTLIKSFINQTPTHFETIKSAIQSKDEKKISLLCHNLKSSSGNLGVMSFSKIAGQVEGYILQNTGNVDFQWIANHLTELESQYAQAKSILQKFVLPEA